MQIFKLIFVMLLGLNSSLAWAQESTSAEVDLKGFKIGMSFTDAAKIVDANSSGCQRATQVAISSDYYGFGDQVIICDGKFEYFGTKLKHFFLAFLDNKLAYVRMKEFETSDETEFPPAFKALAEKYKVNPPIKKDKPNQTTGLTDYVVAFTDKNGNTLEARGQFMKQSFGFLSTADIKFMAKGYVQIHQKRLASVDDAAKQQKTKEQNVKKKDL